MLLLRPTVLKPSTEYWLALTEYARERSWPATNSDARALAIAEASRAAKAAGCTDAMVLYLYANYAAADKVEDDRQLAFAFRKAADALQDSLYHPVRKLFATMRAAQAYSDAAGTTTNYSTEVRLYRGLAVNNMAAVLRDKQTPIEEVYYAGHYLLDEVKQHPKTYALALEHLERGLLRGWTNEYLTFFLRGEAYFHHASHTGGTNLAGATPEEKTRVTRERLEIAGWAFQQAWSMNPRDERIPTEMIRVEIGLGRGRIEMEKWFARAMALEADHYLACYQKLRWLAPEAHGSAAEMLAFARECVASKEWGGDVPLVLADAHALLAAAVPDAEWTGYWKRPGVWPDLQASFEKYFALNPKATSRRKDYVRYAYWCEQWSALGEQLGKLRSTNYVFFGGPDEFKKMVRLAKEKPAPSAK